MGRSVRRIGGLALVLLSLAARPAAAAPCGDAISCCIQAGGDPISCVCPVQGTCAATQFTLDLDPVNSPGAATLLLGNVGSIDFVLNNVVTYTDNKVYFIATYGESDMRARGVVALATANLDAAQFDAEYSGLTSIVTRPGLRLRWSIFDKKGVKQFVGEGGNYTHNYALWARHSEETPGLQAQINAEIAARQAADTTLQNNINNEAAARLAGDANTLASANAYTNTSVSNEAAARQAADTTLQNNINNEAAARAAGDTTLQNNINNEAAARAVADTTLQNNINTEAAARMAADATLANNINNEAAARAAADALLQNNINNEAAARMAADAATLASAQAYADGNFVHRTGGLNETVTGIKTFTSPIAGSVTGSAASFTGALGGDVTGTQGATVVARLRTRNVSAAAPSAGDVLAWDGAQWAPTPQAVSGGDTCGANNSGPTCAGAEAIGQLGWGGSTSRSSALPSGGSSEHWYTMTWANSGTSYHPHVYIAGGGAYYTFDVYTNCAGSALGCASEGSSVSVGIQNWETVNGGDAPLWPTPSPGQSVFVRVRPMTGNQTCQGYTVVFQNG